MALEIVHIAEDKIPEVGQWKEGASNYDLRLSFPQEYELLNGKDVYTEVVYQYREFKGEFRFMVEAGRGKIVLYFDDYYDRPHQFRGPIALAAAILTQVADGEMDAMEVLDEMQEIPEGLTKSGRYLKDDAVKYALQYPPNHFPEGATLEVLKDREDVSPPIEIAYANVKLQPVRDFQTNGANYDLETDDILRKLNDWDEVYGIDISDVDNDKLTVRFKSPPKNSALLAKEIHLFCPEVVQSLFFEFSKELRDLREQSQQVSSELLELESQINFDEENTMIVLIQRLIDGGRPIPLWWD